MANCLWNDLEDNRKFHLANWELVSMCKDYGGFGILNLGYLNIFLLGSWVKRYSEGNGKLWKEIIDFKYDTANPNIFATRDLGASHFFRGFMYAAKAAKMGLGGRLGMLYVLVNEKTKTVFDLWDEETLKCTFRRTFDEALYQVWLEVVQLASTIRFSDCEDDLVWQFCSFGTYSSQSFYKVVNFRGVHQVHFFDLWRIKIPPRVHFFLWLLIHNRVLTRSNLAKRKHLESTTCLFCSEDDTCHHFFFFECAVARQMWRILSEVLRLEL
ncbi:hypothetical protein U9M48_029705, partial [Paspalum notatum var. saurae]